MLVVKHRSVSPVASNHDSIDNLLVRRLLTSTTLPSLESGSLPFINWAEILPGKSFSPHRHGDSTIGMSEFFIIISGQGEFTGGQDTQKVTSGDLVYIPKGEVHSLKNLDQSSSLVYICFGVSNGGQTVLVTT